jgi:chloride channel 7
MKWMARFKNDKDRRDFVTCGAAAGVAAAFRAPVGGLLFALEELSSHWNKSLLLLCFFTTAIVNVTTRMVMSICTNRNCGFFGAGNLVIFHIGEDAQVLLFHFLQSQRKSQHALHPCIVSCIRACWSL